MGRYEARAPVASPRTKRASAFMNEMPSSGLGSWSLPLGREPGSSTANLRGREEGVGGRAVGLHE